jgi:hypothetical protein
MSRSDNRSPLAVICRRFASGSIPKSGYKLRYNSNQAHSVPNQLLLGIGVDYANVMTSRHLLFQILFDLFRSCGDRRFHAVKALESIKDH